jgi:hypothetical protein
MISGTVFFVGLAEYFFFIYGKRKTARRLASAGVEI